MIEPFPIFEDSSGVEHQWSRAEVGVPGDYGEMMGTRTADATNKYPCLKVVFAGKNNQIVEGYAKAAVAFIEGSEVTLDVQVREH